jgi:hypothetical protein
MLRPEVRLWGSLFRTHSPEPWEGEEGTGSHGNSPLSWEAARSAELRSHKSRPEVTQAVTVRHQKRVLCYWHGNTS